MANTRADAPIHATVRAFFRFALRMQRNPNVAKKIRSSTGKSDQIGSAEGGRVGTAAAPAEDAATTDCVRLLDGETPPRTTAIARLKAEPPINVQ